MNRINLLDQHTSNKIAAGEVVERPSSVVKELIENSIDANSKNITIEIEDGGIQLIRVIDDGDGIYKDDIEKAFLPHATSKIKTVEDIYNINTLGFRGEALPSIASVSKVNFKTRTIEDNFGYQLLLDAGVKTTFSEIGINKGTTMEVRDLFFNVPARKKFLKSSSREGSLISDIVLRIALSNPNISFKLFSNGKKAINTYGDGSLSNVIRSIYGKSIYENILKFEYEDDTISIYGYIGKEDIARGSRNNQSIFVNNRYIKNKTIVAAVENAFKSFSTVNKFPFFVLFINVPSENIDVNIHPTKAEIKFKDERLIFKRVFDTVHTALKNDIFNAFMVKEDVVQEEIVEELKLDLNADNTIHNNEKVIINREPSIENIYDKITLNDVKREESLYNKLKDLNIGNNGTNTYPYDDNDSFVSFNKVNESYTTEDLIKPTIVNDNVSEKINTAKFPNLRVIGQFSKTYILAEYADTLYIIDQHAAHEKILFEKYEKDIEKREIVVQPLLVPTIIDLGVDDYEYYIENLSLFKESGFTIEEFGGTTIAVKEVPYFLGKLDSKNLLLDIIDNLKSLGSGKTTEVKLNKIATMACKAAVKANDYLTTIEMEKLISDLRFIDNPFNCPHGRPIIIKFTEYELEKKFRRIV